MNRLIKVFQQKSNRKLNEYLLAKKKSLSPEVPDALNGQKTLCAVLKVESDTWAKAADLLRQEELGKNHMELILQCGCFPLAARGTVPDGGDGGQSNSEGVKP